LVRCRFGIRNFSVSGFVPYHLSQMFGSSSLCSKKPFFWSYQGVFGRAFGRPRLIVWVGDGFAATALGSFREQFEVQALNRFCCLQWSVLSDAAFVLEAGDFMASGAAEVANPLLAPPPSNRIVHEGRISVCGGLCFFSVTR